MLCMWWYSSSRELWGARGSGLLLLDADGLIPALPDMRVEVSLALLSRSELSGKGSYR